MSIRNQRYIFAEVPKVLVYENYFLYDRWMSYGRFDSYFGDDINHFDSDESERQYYYRYVRNFLVLKVCFQDGENVEGNIVLFDARHYNLYILGNHIHTHKIRVNFEHNDHFDIRIPVATIVDTRPNSIGCLAVVNGRWCMCEHKNENGYCDEHQEVSEELKDVDIDRLLTLGELSNLPEFNFIGEYLDENRYEEDEDGYQYRYNHFDSDLDEYDFNEYDFDDFDDRRSGPEGTIEDSSDIEN